MGERKVANILNANIPRVLRSLFTAPPSWKTMLVGSWPLCEQQREENTSFRRLIAAREKPWRALKTRVIQTPFFKRERRNASTSFPFRLREENPTEDTEERERREAWRWWRWWVWIIKFRTPTMDKGRALWTGVLWGPKEGFAKTVSTRQDCLEGLLLLGSSLNMAGTMNL